MNGTSNPTRVGASPVRAGPTGYPPVAVGNPGLGCLTIPLKIHPALSTLTSAPSPCSFFRSLAMPCLKETASGLGLWGPTCSGLSLYPVTWAFPRLSGKELPYSAGAAGGDAGSILGKIPWSRVLLCSLLLVFCMENTMDGYLLGYKK